MRPLKFKEIRKSIINNNEPSQSNNCQNRSPLRRNLFGNQCPDQEMSFKSIKQGNLSPLSKFDANSQMSTNKKNKFGFENSS